MGLSLTEHSIGGLLGGAGIGARNPGDPPYQLEEEAITAAQAAGDPEKDANEGALKMWNTRTERAAAFCMAFAIESQLLTAYFQGFQWVQAAPAANAGSAGYTIQTVEQDAPWQVQCTINMFKQYVVARRALMLVDMPTPVAQPANQSDEACAAAEVATQFLQFFDQRWDAARRYQAMELCRVTCGLAWIVDLWDPDAETQMVVEGGQVATLPKGNASTTVLPPWEVVWEPGTSVLDSSWYVREWKMTIGQVRKMWPGRGLYVKAAQNGLVTSRTGAGGLELEGALLSMVGESGGTTQEPAGQWCTVRQGYERLRSTGQQDMWRVTTWAGDVQLDSGEVDWEPLVPVIYDEALGYPFPFGLGRDLKSPQDRLNISQSRIEMWRNLCSQPKILKHVSTSIADGALTNRPGEVVEWAGAVAPSYMEVPQMQQQALAAPQDWAQWMSQLSGVHDASLGTLPGSAASGKAVQLLQGADATNAQHARANLRSALSIHYRNLLRIAKRYFTEPRWIAIVGEDAGFDVETFTGGQVDGVELVTVGIGSGQQLLPDQKRALITSLFQAGMMAPERAAELDAFLEMMQIGEVKRSPTVEKTAIKQAKREFMMLERHGTIPAPQEWEPGQIHLEEHRKQMLSERFARMDHALQVELIIHFNDTTNQVRIQGATAAQEQAFMASGGGKIPRPGMQPGIGGPMGQAGPPAPQGQ